MQNLHRIYENGAQNLQVTRAEFLFLWCRIFKTLPLPLIALIITTVC